MALWDIPVRWGCGGTVSVEAPTIEKAIELAQFAPFPNSDWDDDEFYVDDLGCDDTRRYYNNDQPDEEITSANEIYSEGEEVQVIDTGEIVEISSYDIDQSGIVSYWVKSCGERRATKKYARKNLRRAKFEPAREVSNVAEFLNEN